MHLKTSVQPPVILLLLTLVSGARGVTCNQTYTSYLDWAKNVKEQDPCEVATILWAMCPNGAVLAPLSQIGATSYPGPSGPQDNPCFCSYPVYNLIAACGDCQVGITFPVAWPSYDNWTHSCSPFNRINYFPMNVPDSTAIPPWARLTILDSGDPSFSYGLSYALAKDKVRLNQGSTTDPTTPITSTSPTSAPICQTCPDVVAIGAGAGAGGLVLGALSAALITLLFFSKPRERIFRPSPYVVDPPTWTSAPPQDSSINHGLVPSGPWQTNNPAILLEPFNPPASPHLASPQRAPQSSGSGSSGPRSEAEVRRPILASQYQPIPGVATPDSILSGNSSPIVDGDDLPPAYQRRRKN